MFCIKISDMIDREGLGKYRKGGAAAVCHVYFVTTDKKISNIWFDSLATHILIVPFLVQPLQMTRSWLA